MCFYFDYITHTNSSCSWSRQSAEIAMTKPNSLGQDKAHSIGSQSCIELMHNTLKYNDGHRLLIVSRVVAIVASHSVCWFVCWTSFSCCCCCCNLLWFTTTRFILTRVLLCLHSNLFDYASKFIELAPITCQVCLFVCYNEWAKQINIFAQTKHLRQRLRVCLF